MSGPLTPVGRRDPAIELASVGADMKETAEVSVSSRGRAVSAGGSVSSVTSRTETVAAQPMANAGEGMSLTLKAVNPNDTSLQLTRSGVPVKLTATSSKDLKKLVDDKMKTSPGDKFLFAAKTTLLIVSVLFGGFGLGYMMAAWGTSRGQAFIPSVFYSTDELNKAKIQAKMQDPKSSAAYIKRVETEILNNLKTPAVDKFTPEERKELLASLVADPGIFDYLDPSNQVNQQIKQMRQTISNKEVEKSKLTDSKGINEAADDIAKLKNDMAELQNERDDTLTHVLKKHKCTMKDRKDRTSSSPTAPTSKPAAATATSSTSKPAISLSAATASATAASAAGDEGDGDSTTLSASVDSKKK